MNKLDVTRKNKDKVEYFTAINSLIVERDKSMFFHILDEEGNVKGTKVTSPVVDIIYDSSILLVTTLNSIFIIKDK
jgi:hypothetical protein